MQDLYQALVAVEPATLVVTILNLFVQVYIVKRFFLSKILKILDLRREAADRELAEAENAKAEAASLRRAYEKNMEQAKEEAGLILDRAKHTAAARSEEILRQAQQRVEGMKTKAAADIAREKQKAIQEARSEISVIALAVAGKVIGHDLDNGRQVQMVERFIEELGDEG